MRDSFLTGESACSQERDSKGQCLVNDWRDAVELGNPTEMARRVALVAERSSGGWIGGGV